MQSVNGLQVYKQGFNPFFLNKYFTVYKFVIFKSIEIRVLI